MAWRQRHVSLASFDPVMREVVKLARQVEHERFFEKGFYNTVND